MVSDVQIFAQRLRQARILRKISMDQLVALIGGLVSKQSISKYESAKMLPNSSVLIALATALNVDVDYFFRSFGFDVNQFEISCNSAELDSHSLSFFSQFRQYIFRIEIITICICPSPKTNCYGRVLVRKQSSI